MLGIEFEALDGTAGSDASLGEQQHLLISIVQLISPRLVLRLASGIDESLSQMADSLISNEPNLINTYGTRSHVQTVRAS